MTVERIGDATLYLGDVRECLREMPDESVHCVMTSPPYWGLRDYGIEPSVWGGSECEHEWGEWREIHDEREQKVSGKSRTTDRFYGDESRRFDGNHQKHTAGAFCRRCGAWLGCLGLEPTPELYVQHLVEVFRELRRVLRRDGTCWVNLGDAYAGGGRAGKNPEYFGKHKMFGKGGWDPGIFGLPQPVPPGLKSKDLVGIPWRVAFALQADGWWLRSDIIWNKPNPMPESVTDRPTRAHEYLFMLSKSARYFYNAEAIREPHTTPIELQIARIKAAKKQKSDRISGSNGATNALEKWSIQKDDNNMINPAGRNRRTVWTIATQPYPEAHFATFPEALVEPCVLAGCPAQTCPECGAPKVRVVERERAPRGDNFGKKDVGEYDHGQEGTAYQQIVNTVTLGFRPTCSCGREDTVPGVMLDPFAGAGTALKVALRLGRRAVGCEIKPEYMAMTRKRIREEAAQGKLSLC